MTEDKFPWLAAIPGLLFCIGIFVSFAFLCGALSDAFTYNEPSSVTITITDHIQGYDDLGNYRDYYLGSDGKLYVPYQVWSKGYRTPPPGLEQTLEIGKTYEMLVFRYGYTGVSFFSDPIFGIKQIVREVK